MQEFLFKDHWIVKQGSTCQEMCTTKVVTATGE